MRMIETTAIITDEGTLTVQVPLTTVPDVCSPGATGLRLRPGARSGWRTVGGLPGCLPISPATGGAAEGHVQGEHGRETGRRWRVGSREKWLYFSYTLALCFVDLGSARGLCE